MKFKIVLTIILVAVIGSIATLSVFSVMNMDHGDSMMTCPLGIVMNGGVDCGGAGAALTATRHATAIDSAFEMIKQQGDVAGMFGLLELLVMGVIAVSIVAARADEFHATTALEYMHWSQRVKDKLGKTVHRWHVMRHKREPRAYAPAYDVSLAPQAS